MSGRRVVIAGTDTEIGKTLAAAGLARALSDRGVDVRAVKPVESGTAATDRAREDGVLLARAARQTSPAEALVRLRDPVAPPVAAEAEGVELDMEAWCREVEAIAARAELTLVEGAGGVLSPLTWEASTRELAARLAAPVLLVAPDRLGTLTHTLTALEALRAGGLEVLGVLYSAPAEPDDSTGANADALRRFAGDVRVEELPRVAGFEEAAGHLEGWAKRLLEDDAAAGLPGAG